MKVVVVVVVPKTVVNEANLRVELDFKGRELKKVQTELHLQGRNWQQRTLFCPKTAR
jgi:hypothetical protein